MPRPICRRSSALPSLHPAPPELRVVTTPLNIPLFFDSFSTVSRLQIIRGRMMSGLTRRADYVLSR